MPQFCSKCGRLMNLNDSAEIISKKGGKRRQIGVIKEYKCQGCGVLRKTDGRGKPLE